MITLLPSLTLIGLSVGLKDIRKRHIQIDSLGVQLSVQSVSDACKRKYIIKYMMIGGIVNEYRKIT